MKNLCCIKQEAQTILLSLKFILFYLFLFVYISSVSAKEYTLHSPDKQISVIISADSKLPLTWSVSFQGEKLLLPSRIGMEIEGSKSAFGNLSAVKKIVNRSSDKVIEVLVPVKNSQIRDFYNEMVLYFNEGYAVCFRAYNNGVTYRIETEIKNNIRVTNETVEFNTAEDCLAYWPKGDAPDYYSHFEAVFEKAKLSELGNTRYAYLPLYLSTPSGKKMVIEEADLYNYPNLFLWGSASSLLTGKFPPVVLKTELKPKTDRVELFKEKAPYIAETTGQRTYPWRIIAIASDDKGLLNNELVYQLSSPFKAEQGKDASWIKPGKVAWDWWNANNIYGVDFRSGINTETYKYYIDFASEYGLDYIILDEGWSLSTTNIKEPNPEIDIPALVSYGKAKNVDVILWALWLPLDKDIEGTLDIYSRWGVKGIKVDFMQRADQYMVNYYERVAKACYDRKLLVDYHGAYKPAGLNRKYPNVISYEGVAGLENDKWSTDITPEHDLILPFTRMVSGPMDYTPGATKNASQEGFYPVYREPMSQGTRAHQAAMYVLYDSPLQMLADNPSNYKKTPDFTRFISKFPTVWDQTVPLEGKIGEYLVMARKYGNQWYIGAMTDWTPRTFEISLDFLDNSRYKIEILKDGINADRYPADFKIEQSVISSKNQKIRIQMAPGGGWAAILIPE